MCVKPSPATLAYIVNEGAILVEGIPEEIAQWRIGQKILFW